MRVQRQPFPAFAVSQVPTAENNQYSKVVYLGWHVLNSYTHILGWHILLPLSPMIFARVCLLSVFSCICQTLVQELPS